MKRTWLPVTAGLMAGAVLLFAQHQRNEVRERARNHRLAVEIAEGLVDDLSAARVALTALATEFGDPSEITQEHFEADVGRVLELLPAVRQFTYAPQGVIRFVAPLSRGTGSLGLNLLTSQVDQSAAVVARLTNSASFQGPFSLKQGGVGLVLRQPAMGPDRRFVGLVSAVLDWEQILNRVSQQAAAANAWLAVEIEDSVSTRYRSASALVRGPDVLVERFPLLDGVLTVRLKAMPRPLGAVALNLLAAVGVGAVVTGLVGWQQQQRRRQAGLANTLEQQNARVSAFFDAHQDPVFWLDRNGCLLRANHAGQAELPSVLSSQQSFSQLFSAKELQAEALVQVIEADLNACLQAGSHVGEWKLQQRSEQQPRYWRVSCTLLHDLQLLLLVDDISVQRRQEQRNQEQQLQFRAVFEQSADALILISVAGAIKPGMLNGAALTMFGLKDRDAALNLTLEDLSPEYQPGGTLSRAQIEHRMRRVINEGWVSFEWTHVRIDTGAPWPAQVTLSLLAVADADHLSW